MKHIYKKKKKAFFFHLKHIKVLQSSNPYILLQKQLLDQLKNS